MKTIKVRVYRYNPDRDGEARYTTHDVLFEEQKTLLMVLRDIYREEGLTFRWSCRIGFCGMCTVKLNGKPVLACQTIIQEPSEILVEPLDANSVIRDLVVER